MDLRQRVVERRVRLRGEKYPRIRVAPQGLYHEFRDEGRLASARWALHEHEVVGTERALDGPLLRVIEPGHERQSQDGSRDTNFLRVREQLGDVGPTRAAVLHRVEAALLALDCDGSGASVE